MKLKGKYVYTKNGFRDGEYSIYWTSGNSIFYAFGVSKKYEAIAVCAFLNGKGFFNPYSLLEEK